MSMNRKYVPLAWAVGLIILIMICVGGYQRFFAPTQIAFVNYPEYLIAQDMAQKIDVPVKVTALKWGDEVVKSLKDYDFVFLFGMGLSMTQNQQALLDTIERPMYISSMPKDVGQKNTITDKQKKDLREYMQNSTSKNWVRMLNYVRREVDGKKFGTMPIEKPDKVPFSRFFHIDDTQIFGNYKEYLDYYKKMGFYHEGNPTVMLVSGNGGGDLPSLIKALEKRNLNVVATNGGRSIDLLKQIQPNLVIYQPHGRFTGDPETVLPYLEKNGIPLLCPIKAEQAYDTWLKDQKGMSGPMLSQSVTMAELDGSVAPFVLSALYKDKKGFYGYQVVPDRLERFADMTRKMIDLQLKKNYDKKIAIIYYKGHGKGAMIASGLEVGDSLLNLLRHLQKRGFNTGKLPEKSEDLLKMIQDHAAVFGSYAEGAINDFLKKANPAVITPEEYAAWVKKAMPADLYETVVNQFGEFPGKYFATEDGKLQLGVLRLGNIVLLPQAMAGEGADKNKIVHGTKKAPPHYYIATYLWIRYGFKADAMMHFGTHGSLEFTPWKQVALSSYDWPDVLVGEMPHAYLYVMNDMGEALIAKRRSYATLVSHLTAPFMNAELFGPVRALDEVVEQYEFLEDPMMRSEYASSIIKRTKDLHFDQELKFSPDFAKGKLVKEDLEMLHNYLHEIGDEKVHRGMYALGRPYTDAEAKETAKLMMVDTVADIMFQRDVKAGKVARKMNENQVYFRKNYLIPAGKKIDGIFAAYDAGKIKLPLPPLDDLKDVAPLGMLEMQKNLDKNKAAKMPPAGMGGKKGKMPPDAMAKAMSKMSPEQRKQMKQMMVKMGLASANDKPKRAPELLALEAYDNLKKSTPSELDGMVTVFSGGYLMPKPGVDPIGNPETVPTGKNLYAIDPERCPTRESYAVGKKLADVLIKNKLKATGKYPKKVGFSLWGGEFINTHGSDVGEIFYLLGVEPIWDRRGRVRDLRLIPASELGRPRIDVVVQTAVQFRGCATSRMRLIDLAVRMAAADREAKENYVREGSVAAAKMMIENGITPEEAAKLADARIFGGGTGEIVDADDSANQSVSGTAMAGDTWDDNKVVADAYIKGRGTLYTESNWGKYVPGAYKAALVNTDTVVQSRSSSLWGPLSLDHVFEFTGGMNLAVKHITGREPDVYFNDLRTPGRAKVQDGRQAIMVEARATVLNEKYIKEMMEEGPSGAGTFSNAISNTYGWEVMKPDMLQDSLWEEYKKVYIDDSMKLGMREYFEKKNPYALQEMTAVMLETIRKDLWKADAKTVKDIAKVHAELVKKFGPACSSAVCNNAKLQEMLKKNLGEDLKKAYEQQLNKTLNAPVDPKDEVAGQVLKEQKEKPMRRPQQEASAKRNLMVIGGIVLLIIITLLWGSRKKRRNE